MVMIVMSPLHTCSLVNFIDPVPSCLFSLFVCFGKKIGGQMVKVFTGWIFFQSPSHYCRSTGWTKSKGKGFPYLLPSVGPGADPNVEAVSLQVTISHLPGGRLLLLSARPAVTFSAAELYRPIAGTKSYNAWWQRHIGVNNLPKVVMQLLPRVGFEPITCWSQVQRSTRCAT